MFLLTSRRPVSVTGVVMQNPILNTDNSASLALPNTFAPIIRGQDYSSNAVGELCAAKAKVALSRLVKPNDDFVFAGTKNRNGRGDGLLTNAPNRSSGNSRDRVLAYLDLHIRIIRGSAAAFTCLGSAMAHEIYLSNTLMRNACFASMSSNPEQLERDIAGALKENEANKGITANSLALHTQTVLQGALILAKARNAPCIAVDSITHLRRYFEILFTPP